MHTDGNFNQPRRAAVATQEILSDTLYPSALAAPPPAPPPRGNSL